MKKLLLAAIYSLIAAWPVMAADMSTPKPDKPKQVTPAPAPVLSGTSGFWAGVVGNVGLSPNANAFTLATPITTNSGNTVGFTTGLMGGVTGGYGLNIGSLYVGASFDALYDFSRGCMDVACLASRNNGFLLEEGLEVGSTISTVNSSLPAPLPAPNGLPTSVWSNLAVVLRGGYAERTLNLCAYTGSLDGTSTCGSGMIAAPYAGAKLKFMASQNSEFFLKWDHIFWGNGYNYAPQIATGGNVFTNTVSINHEDLLGAGYAYHF